MSFSGITGDIESGLYLENEDLNKYFKVTLSKYDPVKGESELLVGYLAGEISFSSTSEYSPNFLSTALDASNKLLSTVGIASQFVKELLGGDANGIQTGALGNFPSQRRGAIGLYKKIWQAGSYMPLSIPMELINTQVSDDVMSQAWSMMAQSHPKSDGRSTLSAPGGLVTNVAQSSRSPGTWTISIGEWFKAPGFILESMTLAPSQILDKSKVTNGTTTSPISVGVNISFSSENIMDEDSFLAMYRPPR